MLHLSPIYAMLHLFGHRTLIQLKGFTITERFPQNNIFQNWIFISKSLKGLLPSIFNNWFKFSFESHSHDTRWSNLGYLKIPSYRTKTYGRYSMFVNSIYVWNHLQSCHQNIIFHQLRENKFKEVSITLFLNRYN